MYVLCGANELSYNFKIYSDSAHQSRFKLTDESHLRGASNTVIRHFKVAPDNLNYVIHFDNYYSSPSLMSFLALKGIFALETVRQNGFQMHLK